MKDRLINEIIKPLFLLIIVFPAGILKILGSIGEVMMSYIQREIDKYDD